MERRQTCKKIYWMIAQEPQAGPHSHGSDVR